MPRGTPLRNIRISDELWESVKARAAVDGRDVSSVVRELLERWVKRK